MSSASATIVESARLCAQSFVQIQSTPSRDRWSQREFEDQLDRFKIWTGSLGVFAADTASLDFRLKDDQDIKDVLIHMITSLREQVEQLARPSPLPTVLEEENEIEPKSSGSSVSSTASSWKLSSDSDSAKNIGNVPPDLHRRSSGLSQITDIVNRLYRLSTVIRKPISQSEHARVAQYIEKTKHDIDFEGFESYVKWKIQKWCPDTTAELINRLSGAVVYKRKKLLYRKRHQEKLNEGTKDSFIARDPKSIYPDSNKLQVPDTGSLQKVPEREREQRSQAFSTTNVSSIDKQAVHAAVHAYERSAAQSGITKSAVARLQQLVVPPPPKLKAGREAKCPYCFKFLKEDQLKGAHWTRHILKDIDPYICLFEECDEPDTCFKSIDDWLNHIQWQHTLFFSCQSVGHESELFNSRTGLEQHMEREHSGEFTETQLPFIVNKSAKPSRDTFVAFANARQSIGASEDPKNLCPLCPFSPKDDHIPSPSINLVSSNTRPEDREFKITLDHITNHMESIALLSLPLDEHLEHGVSDELKHRIGEDIDQDVRSLPSTSVVDEPSSAIISTEGSSGEDPEGSSGEDLPIDDYVLKEGWDYVFKSPSVPKTTHVEPELDETLKPFVKRFWSERTEEPPKSPSTVPFRRDPDSVERGYILSADNSLGFQIGQIPANHFSINAPINYYSPRTGEPPKPSSTVPFRRDPDFVECGDILAQIDTRLSLPASRVALVGLGGVGKSNLAIEYSYRVRDRFPQTWIFWVHASNATRFEAGYRMIASRIRLPGRDEPAANILQLVSRWLSDEANGRWMMVLDNADDSTIFSRPHKGGATSDTGAAVSLSTFIPDSPNGSILVTSRSRDAALMLTGRLRDIIKVEPMDKHHALLLFGKKLHNGFDKDDANELIHALDYIPLAITQATAYIKKGAPRVTVAKYLDAFRQSDKNQANLLNRDIGDLRRDREAANSIITTLQISFEYIREKRPSAARLLSLMSFFDRQGIPEFILLHYDDREDEISIDLDDKTDVDENDVKYEEENGIKFEEDMCTLTAFSLVTVNVNNKQFEVRRLVQLSVRKWLELNGELDKWAMIYIKILFEVFPEGDYENWTICQLLFSHVEAMLAYRPRERKSLIHWSEVLNKAGRYAALHGNYSTAEEMTGRALEEGTKMLGKTHPDTLTSVNNLASVLLEQGEYEAAEQMSRRALDGREKALGSEHPDTLTSVSNMASVLLGQRKYETAEDLNRRALDGREKALGKEHPNTLTSVSNLALVLQEQEKYEAAEELNRRALDGREKALGKEHPNTLTSVSNLALVLQKQGMYEGAEELNRRALDGRTKTLGIEHPNTLTSVSNLALVLQKQGKYEAAEQLFRRALDGRMQALGEEHPDTLTSVSNLALVLQEQGKYEAAEQMSRRALDGREKILGKEHPDTLTSVSNLALVLEERGKYKAAEQTSRALGGIENTLRK
ncbi:hypothetical protein MMC07_010003, partial [Pseudocyphellaria aurata]|nr:hypothetical protein [Pseudocyphellaria aurata]